jgi:hypothetical protein
LALQWTLLHVRASAPEVTYRASFGPPEFPLSIGRPTERRGVCLTGLPPHRGLLVSPPSPRACALGCNLSPLRGWKPAGPFQCSFENRALAHTLKRCSVRSLGRARCPADSRRACPERSRRDAGAIREPFTARSSLRGSAIANPLKSGATGLLPAAGGGVQLFSGWRWKCRFRSGTESR